jgi:hypothetical protein
MREGQNFLVNNIGKNELIEHYEFYLDNCKENEIPIGFDNWCIEYKNELLLIINN